MTSRATTGIRQPEMIEDVSTTEPFVRPDAPVGGTDAGADAVRHPYAWPAVVAIAACKVVLNAVASPRYGWHRDELYYADAGRHLAFGYVDFPPLTPALAALARVLGGDGLVGLRAVASLAGTGALAAAALLCRELGGTRRAQAVACLGALPMLVASNAMFQTVSFDQVTSLLLIWGFVRVLDRPTIGRWAAVGVLTGVAFETKYTAVLLVGALGIGSIVTGGGRAALRGRGPWVAVGLALALALPNLVWQAGHDWASVSFLTGRGEVRDENPPLRFVIELAIMTGPFLLALRGLSWLGRDDRRRGLAQGLALVPVAWLLAGGKAYYAVPACLAMVASGAVATDELPGGWDGRRWPVLVTSMTAAVVLLCPMLLPLVPARTAADIGILERRDDFINELGWPELADDAAAAWRRLPDDARRGTALVAMNYGVAGALDRWGPERGLPPVVSGHLSWRFWPITSQQAAARRALVVGWSGTTAPQWCHEPQQVGVVEPIDRIDTEEAGAPIWWCRLDETIEALRPHLVSNS